MSLKGDSADDVGFPAFPLMIGLSAPIRNNAAGTNHVSERATSADTRHTRNEYIESEKKFGFTVTKR